MTEKFKITYEDIEKIVPYKNNPRLNLKAVSIVAKSISEYGFTVPIVVDKDYVIITGDTRFKAAQELKMTQVPVIVRDDLSEEQTKAFRILDNRTSELASWDYSILENELNTIKKGFLTGFENMRVDFLPKIAPDKEPIIQNDMIIVLKIKPALFEVLGDVRADLSKIKDKYNEKCDDGIEINFQG